jgi:predicted metal-dependent phosphoesterase TrpH
MIEAKADLHIHTTFSDGVKSPEEIIEMASKVGLKAIAITDHDSYAGYKRAKSAGIESGIEVITGIEITSDYKGREVHILGYGFDVANEPLIQFIHSQKLRRYKRARKMIENLNKSGFDISLDEVTAESRTMNISRNHIASLLVKKGLVANVRTVFDRWLGNHADAYFKTEYETAESVIQIIQQAGGVAVLAHPGLYYLEEDISSFIDYGIDGFECIHPSHNFELQRRYRERCEKHNLLETGGSDFHGYKKEEDSYFGTIAINYELVTRLLERCKASSVTR